jgi:hypothetical protein
MKDKIKYNANGYVLGNLWGGGIGGYRSEPLEAKTKEDLLKQAKKKLKDGSLDSGMGFDGLLGAKLLIEKVTTKTIGGRDFVHREHENEYIGNLTEEQLDFLEEL